MAAAAANEPGGPARAGPGGNAFACPVIRAHRQYVHAFLVLEW